MELSTRLAKHFGGIYFGGNWTDSNLFDSLKDVSWQEAVTQVSNCNTIATLTFHINYFVEAVLKVLEGGPLDAKDKLSFTHPPIESKEDWDNFLEKIWINAKRFAELVEQLPEQKLSKVFVDKKYGDYYSNLTGIIEHSHYHLGQIAILKKLIRNQHHLKFKNV